MIATKLEDIRNAFKENDLLELYRVQLYRNGWLNFFDRPFWGLPQDSSLLRQSGHSEVISYLERFGIFGFVYIYALFAGMKTVISCIHTKELKYLYRVVFMTLLVFAAINRLDNSPEIGLAVFLLVPIALQYIDRTIIGRQIKNQMPKQV